MQSNVPTANIKSVAETTAQETGLSCDTTLAAAEEYIRQVEEHDGRTIDPDNLHIEDALFLIQAVIAGHDAGDLESHSTDKG